MEDYLVHHGVLGQKWGVRRYQNSDGSLTSAGRKHYGTGESSGNKSVKAKGEPRRKQLTDEQKAKVKKVVKTGAIVAGTALAAYGAYKIGSNNPQIVSAVSKGKHALGTSLNKARVVAMNKAEDAAESAKRISKEASKIKTQASKELIKGFKEGIPEQAHATGKTFGKVLVGGVTWMAGVEVADLMTNGYATDKILTAYNDHTKKDNRVKTSYRNKNRSYEEE